MTQARRLTLVCRFNQSDSHLNRFKVNWNHPKVNLNQGNSNRKWPDVNLNQSKVNWNRVKVNLNQGNSNWNQGKVNWNWIKVNWNQADSNVNYVDSSVHQADFGAFCIGESRINFRPVWTNFAIPERLPEANKHPVNSSIMLSILSCSLLSGMTAQDSSFYLVCYKTIHTP